MERPKSAGHATSSGDTCSIIVKTSISKYINDVKYQIHDNGERAN